jgi:alpha-1,6-mannosyltransferase
VLKDHAALSRAVGFAGSALIAIGGLGAGALPVGVPFVPSWQHARLGLVCVYSGLALLLAGWWWYGRAAGDDPRGTWPTLALWVSPLLLAPPMFSRDVYSYLAQGLMIDSGMDVYRHGPAVLGGLIADQVPAIWQHTPSPYGPVFLIVARTVAGPLSAHLLLGIAAMRLVAVAGLVLLAAAVRVLAREAGVSPAAATWLAVLNPLVLIHLVGGAHNDALMVGLLAAGLAAAVRRRPLVATLLIVAAALVKAPAGLGLLAVAAIWADRLPGRWPWARAAGAVVATAAAATVVITAVAGTGYGWVGALGTPISAQNWSLTGMLGRVTARLLAHGLSPGLSHGFLSGLSHGFLSGLSVSVSRGLSLGLSRGLWRGPDGVALAVELWRWVGLLAVVIVAAVVWTHRDRLGPVYGLGIVLVALVVFGPAIRPWYLVWGLVPIAAAAGHRRVRRLLALSCAALVLVVLPDGFAANGERVLLAAAGAVTGIGAFLLVRLLAALPESRLAWTFR